LATWGYTVTNTAQDVGPRLLLGIILLLKRGALLALAPNRAVHPLAPSMTRRLGDPWAFWRLATDVNPGDATLRIWP